MATNSFTIRDIETSDSEVAVIESKSLVKLRKTNSNGKCTVNGTYSEGTFTFESLQGEGIGQYIGFFHRRIDDHGEGQVLYRVSIDDGSTWLYYDSNQDDWVEATSNSEWNAETEVDGNLEDVDNGIGRSLKFKVKLVPGENNRGIKTFSPVLRGLVVYYEIITSFFVDMKRSLKQFFDAKFRPQWKDELTANNPIDKLDYQDNYNDLDIVIKEPIKVFNETTNSENVYDSVSNNIIYFEPPQQGDLEVYYHVKIPTYVNPADEQLSDATVPNVIINYPTIQEERELLYITENEVVEVSKANKMARIRNKGPLIYRIIASISVQADFDLQASPMADEIRHLFSSANPSFIPSVDGGFDYHVISYANQINPNVLNDSRVVYQSEIDLLGFDFGNEQLFENVKLGEADIDVPLVQNIEICTSTGGSAEVQLVN